jgi:hypothetical protein
MSSEYTTGLSLSEYVIQDAKEKCFELEVKALK